MSKLGVLASRDFWSRARGGAYIVTTILGVLLLVGLTFGPSIIDEIDQSFERVSLDLYVLDRTGVTHPILTEAIDQAGPGTSIATELIGPDGLPAVEDDQFGTRAAELLGDSDKDGVLVIDEPKEQSQSPALFTLVLRDASNIVANEAMQDLLNRVVRKANADRLDVTEEELALLWAYAPMSVQQLRDTPGEGASTQEVSEDSRVQSIVLAYFLLFILYMAMIMYGNMIASGVAEEKSSRIMEIMVSSVRPIELMTGKILGIGALGLFQFAVWVATGVGLSALGKSGVLDNTLFGSIEISGLPVSTLIWFGVFFVLGFVLYAAVFAAAGASVSRVEEVNQVSTMIMMLIIVAFLVAYYSFINPNSSLAVVCSMIPWLAPMVMFARVVLGHPPTIQVIASLILMLVAIVLSTWMAARIYRIGVLMYGKRPGLKDIVRYVIEP